MRPPSIWELLVILVIVVLLFGTKKLKNIGTDLGSAIKGFRASMRDGEESASSETPHDAAHGRVIEGDKVSEHSDKPSS